MKKKNSAENADSLQISGRSVLIMAVAIILLACMLWGLNALDGYRKYKQYEALNTTFENSVYSDRISALLKRFNPQDSAIIHEITALLDFIIEDNDLIDNTDLYIKYNDQFYKIIRDHYSCYSQLIDELNFLPTGLSEAIELLDKENGDERALYSMMNTTRNIISLVKIENGYLELYDYRK
jgi:hypothetical protein